MATYKVLQDIEAEDKLLGPLTLKQFIFAAITLVIGFIEFKLITTPGPFIIKAVFIFVLAIPMAGFGFLAAPIGREQPNEIWLLARLRYMFKPRRRIWDQNGISDLVTITAPRHIETVFTNGLDQNEVEGRLQALANTLDSRGWAVKNVNVNLYAQPGYLNPNAQDADRLVNPSSLPQDVPIADINPADDIMDEHNNPTAQHLNQMMQANATAHRQAALAGLQAATQQGNAQAGGGVQLPGQQADYWFMNQPATPPQPPKVDPKYALFTTSQVVKPGTAEVPVPVPSASEQALIANAVHAEQANPWSSHMKRIAPLDLGNIRPAVVAPSTQAQTSTQTSRQTNAIDPANIVLPGMAPYVPSIPGNTANATATKTGTNSTNPAILDLARNDDLNVATIARQANRINKPDADGEVVISLR